MSEKFQVEVSDELAAKLHERDDVHDTLVLALREVYGDGSDEVEEKQAELKERMGIKPSDEEDDTPTPTEAELSDLQQEQLKQFLRRERTNGIDK